MQRIIKGLNPFFLSSIAGLVTLVQFLLSALFYNPKGNLYVSILGGVCLVCSLLVGWMAMTEVRWQGKPQVKKGKIQLRPLITDGVFSLSRQPQQGTAWILMSLALMLAAQHWVVAALGAVSIVLAYANALKADQAALEQYGDVYRQYMESVPLVNILAGIIGYWMHKRSG